MSYLVPDWTDFLSDNTVRLFLEANGNIEFDYRGTAHTLRAVASLEKSSNYLKGRLHNSAPQHTTHVTKKPITKQNRWYIYIWLRHQMETLSALLAICAGDTAVTGDFPAQRPMTRSVAVFFELRLNKRLSKQWWGWWFETPPRVLWRHCHEYHR